MHTHRISAFRSLLGHALHSARQPVTGRPTLWRQRVTSRLLTGLLGLMGSASALLLSACGAPDDPDAVTYHGAVAPVLAEYCLACHRTGGIGPFPLETYEQAKAAVSAMRLAVINRTMPPQPLTNDGTCQSFTNARWMPEEAQKVIGAWMDQGTLEGTPDDTPAPTLLPAPALSGTVLELQSPLYTPKATNLEGSNDDYRCFRLDPGLSADALVSGFEIVPGNDALVHHVLVFSVDPTAVADPSSGATNAQVMDALESQSGGTPGWDCYGLTGEGVVPNTLLASWAPGEQATHFPDKTGLRLRQQDNVVIQVHYNMDYAQGSDESLIRLETQPSLLLEGVNILGDGLLATLDAGAPFPIPPGEEFVQFRWSFTFEELVSLFQTYTGSTVSLSSMAVYGIYPHMHALGSQMQVTLKRGAEESCAADVRAWDFNYQQFYFYEAPVVLVPGDEVEVLCIFDSRGQTQIVYPGLDTHDEMCMLGAFISLEGL